MCPRRLLINRSPRYFSMRQCRRLPTVSTSHLWMLPCRRPHKVPCLSTSLHRWVLASASSFSVDICSDSHTQYGATRCCHTTTFHGSSLLAVFSRTILWTAKTSFVSPPPSVQDDIGTDSPSLTCTLTRSNLDCDDLVRTLVPRALLQPPPGLEQLAPPPGLAIGSHLVH